MHSRDDELAHFDHALNACLLLSYVALRQGDAVGLCSFASSTPRYIAPNKGNAQLGVLLNGVYDLHSTASPPDLLQATRRLLTLQRRRALVVVMTNLRAEDEGELLLALRLLRQRHLVLVASLREPILREMAEAMDLERAELRSAKQTVKAQNLTIEKLEHRLARLLRIQFGRSSEKMDLAQLRLAVTLQGHEVDAAARAGGDELLCEGPALARVVQADVAPRRAGQFVFGHGERRCDVVGQRQHVGENTGHFAAFTTEVKFREFLRFIDQFFGQITLHDMGQPALPDGRFQPADFFPVGRHIFQTVHVHGVKPSVPVPNVGKGSGPFPAVKV